MLPRVAANQVFGMTVAQALRVGRHALKGTPSGPLDARLLLGHVMGRPAPWLVAHGDDPVDQRLLERFLELVRRRAGGEPVAYLRGFIEWFGAEYEVTPDVLVPRPETELLLEQALLMGRRLNSRTVADLGTGSGVLAVELARRLPGALILATDVSAAALEVASHNARRHGVDKRIRFLPGSLLDPLPDCPDLLVANLPYLSEKMLAEAEPEVRAEPRVALLGGQAGLELYGGLLSQLEARLWSVPLLLETDPRLAGELAGTVRRTFPSGHVTVLPDLAGLDRVVVYSPDEDEVSNPE